MGKASSQWDFGELFEESELKKTYSVSELTGAIRKTLESGFGRVRVTGEVSNFRAQGSGHCYFALKDKGAQVSSVLFRSERVSHRDELENGVKVILEGDLTVYEARGQYQLIVRSVELQGVGALQQAFERLKKKLETEGLFTLERKRPVPPYCFRVGLVTSSSAAALRDALQVAGRRHPALEFVLCSSRVQGQGAAEEIATSIDRLNRFSQRQDRGARLGAILVTRGGGSLEDLWAFNEEVVARAVAASELPVVSAVGHEVDFTICDFVADLRAPTPSAAAEILTEGIFSTRESVRNAAEQLRSIALRQLEYRDAVLDQVGKRLRTGHPRRALELRRQRIDDYESTMARQVFERTRREAQFVSQLGRQLEMNQPLRLLERAREDIRDLTRRAIDQTRRSYKQGILELDQKTRMLRLLSPLNVLERGYSITRDTQSGHVVDSVAKVKEGAALTTLVKDGEIFSDVRRPSKDCETA